MSQQEIRRGAYKVRGRQELPQFIKRNLNMDAPAPPQMNIKVRGTDGTELFFRLKPTTKLKKMMEVFLQKQGANENSCRFVYDGARVRHDDTPKGLNMEDGDVIEAVVEQSGGAFSFYLSGSSCCSASFKTQV